MGWVASCIDKTSFGYSCVVYVVFADVAQVVIVSA